jgi:hypothetical protein
MSHSKVLLRALLAAVCAVFVTTAVAAPVSKDEPTQNVKDDIRVTLRADLNLTSELSLGTLPASETAAHPTGGFCACGCGIRCQTSADCGGAACRPFITCCARSAPEVSVGLGKSTRAGEQPAVNVKCK